jgi:hypothetical protein
MNGPMNGTSIQDLQMLQNMQDMQYGAMQGQQFEHSHNSAHNVQQGQHDPYYSIPDERRSCPQPDNIEDLATDISNSLPSVPQGYEQFEDGVVDEEEQSGGYLSMIPSQLVDPLLIIVIYAILSQTVVRENIGRYVTQINPDASGDVSLLGILIYGTVLAVLFVLTKRLLG